LEAKTASLALPVLWHTVFCAAQYTALAGSHVPMHRWFSAIYLTIRFPNISSSELGRQIRIRQKTAWSMQSRIRRMVIEDHGLLQKIVTAAEDLTGQ
jgi:hypothetical protein